MQRKTSTTMTGNRSRFRGWIPALMATLVMALASPVSANEYDPQRAGHPLRIVAYVIHPVGVAFDYLFMRPAHWLVSQEPFKTAFGHED